MLRSTIIEIFESVWPMILICSVVMVSLRIAYIIKNKPHFILYQELFMLGFVIYIMCLFYVVTFQDVDASWSTSNFVPFKEMFRYSFGSRLFVKNVLGNLLMFVPFGFFTSYILKASKARLIIFLTLLTSVTIEITQAIIGRVFDIDDILLNIVGGLIGYIIYRVLDKIKKTLPDWTNKPYLYSIFLIIAILLFIIFTIFLVF